MSTAAGGETGQPLSCNEEGGLLKRSSGKESSKLVVAGVTLMGSVYFDSTDEASEKTLTHLLEDILVLSSLLWLEVVATGKKEPPGLFSPEGGRFLFELPKEGLPSAPIINKREKSQSKSIAKNIKIKKKKDIKIRLSSGGKEVFAEKYAHTTNKTKTHKKTTFSYAHK